MFSSSLQLSIKKLVSLIKIGRDSKDYILFNLTLLVMCCMFRTGELTNRLAADTQVVQSAVTENVSILARYTLQMLISIGLMFYISAKLTAVLLSVVPVIAIAAVQYG